MKQVLLMSSMAALTLISLSVLAQPNNKNSFDIPITEGITAYPAITISTQHDDNIFLQDKIGVRSSWITELSPSIMLGTQKGPSFYTAKYTLKAGRYHSSRDDDYVEHLFNIDTHTEFDHRNKLDVNFDYEKLHEKRGSGISDGTGRVSSTPDEYRDAFFSGTYTYGGSTAIGRIELNASHLDRKYTNHRDNSRVFDRNEDEFGGTFFYRVMPKTYLLFEVKYKDINYDNTPLRVPKLNGDETSYQAGVTWEATAKTTGIAKLGKTYKNFDASQYKDDDFTSWELAVEWAPLTYSVFKIKSSSTPIASTGSSTYIKEQLLALSWHHAWSERVKSKIRARFTSDDYLGSTREDDREYYLAGMEYQFRRGIAFGIDYTYKTRDSNRINSDYTDNIFMLTAKIGL
ncbi:MAG: outer membrane beta-barrel protein [Gammaproteobacteria bacterium]|nr:outer membrane beta-barrel protein [Gammaproteobacteria bacterium]